MRPGVSRGARRVGVLADVRAFGLSLLAAGCSAGPSERSESVAVVVREETKTPDAGGGEPLLVVPDAGAEEVEPEPPAEPDPVVESAVMKLTIVQLELARALAELDAIREKLDAIDAELDDPPANRPPTERERQVHARLKALRAEAKLYSHGETAPAASLGLREFAEMIEERARQAEGKFQRLIHPQLGLFVVHNVAGAMFHVERITRWPRGDYDYGVGLDDEVAMKRLVRASQFKLGGKPPVRKDEIGCEHRGETVQEATDTVFDVWASLFGTEWDHVPDRHVIQPWAGYSARNREVKDDLDGRAFALMQRVALAVSHYVVVAGVRLDFGMIDGEWYVLAIDILDDACG